MSANIPEHELPNWMKQAQRGVDWGALLVLAFALLAGWSFLVESQLSATNENEHIVFQASDITEAMREGIFYTRWSPYAVGGYGAPIPHYYPQAAAYLVALVDLLFTNDLIFAMRLVYLIGFLIAGAALYSLVAQRSNALVAVFAAIAYLFNPYLGLTVPHLLGDLPLFLGLAIIPLLLWIVNRLLLREQAIDMAFMALIVAIFILTIPRLLPQAFVLVLLLIGLDFTQSHKQTFPRIIWVLGANALGFGLAAFYWLPMLLEINLVQWHQPIMAAEPRIVRFPEIFSQATFLDAGILNYENYFALGLGLTVLTVFSGLALLLKRELFRFHGAFLLYGIAMLALLMLFPNQSELLASISLCLSIGGAYLLNIIRKPLGGALVFFLLILIVGLASPYWIIPSPPLPIIESDSREQFRYEASGYGIAVLPAGQPIPSNVVPRANSIFTDEMSLDSNRILNLELSLISEDAYHAIYQVFSTSPNEIIYQRAWFPGWEAWLDNSSLLISPSENGLMRLEIPVANAPLFFLFGSTWIRSLSWLIAILAFLTALVIWWLRWRRMGSDYDNSPLLAKHESGRVFVALIILTGLHILLPMLLNLPSRYSLQAANYVRSEVDTSLQLLAYEIRDNRLYLYWEASRPALNQYQVRLRLVSGETTILQTAYSHPGYFPTNRWLRGFVVSQSYNLPNGNYELIIDVFSCNGICGEIGNPQPSIELRLE